VAVGKKLCAHCEKVGWFGRNLQTKNIKVSHESLKNGINALNDPNIEKYLGMYS
jgi:hypothetical protein